MERPQLPKPDMPLFRCIVRDAEGRERRRYDVRAPNAVHAEYSVRMDYPFTFGMSLNVKKLK